MYSESFPCQLVSWIESFRLARDLARSVKHSGYSADLVIAIGRGGYVPARVVCDFLMESRLTSIKMEHWGVAASKKAKATVRYPLAVDISGQKILIIDDVTDTGDTLHEAAGYIRGLGAGEIRTAVLQHKTCSSFAPDYFSEMIKDWRWIIYPWAAHEDLVGFTEKVLAGQPLSIEQICLRLKDRYSLQVDEEVISEALEDLIAWKKADRMDHRYKKTFKC